ncbi:GTP-binding protein [Coemansia thaxteri]|uniref:GTP-binding protein n=1 Tax=Coemansia thaxteri TaxID=2663907 RepID=A0A9W8BCL6_9FUNG|nr:GTP-binding protein [Coemansia thaxteri]KAJ2484370.1 GTP-binding protein [Coemansia sp. RSA 2320]
MASNSTTNRLSRNVVVLGGMGVGKSTAIRRFISDEFIERYYPTVSGSFTKTITIGNKEYNLTILDTTGQDETSLLDSTHVGPTDAFVIAFSVTFRKSFEIAQVIRDKILDMSGVNSVGILLVGNKCDLVGERQVSREEAQKMADSFGCPYIETSAKENINIEEVFIQSVNIANKASDGDAIADEPEGAEGGEKPFCIVM